MIDNSKPFRRLFSFKGRATRLEFNIVIFLVLLFWCGLVWLTLYTPYFKRTEVGVGMYALIVLSILTIYIGMAVAVRRNHDLGNGGMPSSLQFSLSFTKGVPYFNEFGSDPFQDYQPQLDRLNQLVAEDNEKETEGNKEKEV